MDVLKRCASGHADGQKGWERVSKEAAQSGPGDSDAGGLAHTGADPAHAAQVGERRKGNGWVGRDDMSRLARSWLRGTGTAVAIATLAVDRAYPAIGTAEATDHGLLRIPFLAD